MAIFNPPHPGEVIKENILSPLGMSITHAAKHLGVSRGTFSKILNCRGVITPEMALRLEMVFKPSAESWLKHQADYDLWQVRQHISNIHVLPIAERFYIYTEPFEEVKSLAESIESGYDLPCRECATTLVVICGEEDGVLIGIKCPKDHVYYHQEVDGDIFDDWYDYSSQREERIYIHIKSSEWVDSVAESIESRNDVPLCRICGNSLVVVRVTKNQYRMGIRCPKGHEQYRPDFQGIA